MGKVKGYLQKITIKKHPHGLQMEEFLFSIERQKNQAEALSALKNLGYSPSEAANAIALASDIEDTSSTPDLIKKALKLLSPKEN